MPPMLQQKMCSLREEWRFILVSTCWQKAPSTLCRNLWLFCDMSYVSFPAVHSLHSVLPLFFLHSPSSLLHNSSLTPQDHNITSSFTTLINNPHFLPLYLLSSAWWESDLIHSLTSSLSVLVLSLVLQSLSQLSKCTNLSMAPHWLSFLSFIFLPWFFSDASLLVCLPFSAQ